MVFKWFGPRRQWEDRAADLYLALVQQARLPVFYAHWQVPDVLEGRLDMIILHAWMVMRRLAKCSDTAAVKDLNQALFDRMFADMDRNLREMGVMDLAVGKRVCRMAEAFYGRVNAYDGAEKKGGAAMKEALERNLYQKASSSVSNASLESMLAYIQQQETALLSLADADLLQGKITFQKPQADHD